MAAGAPWAWVVEAVGIILRWCAKRRGQAEVVVGICWMVAGKVDLGHGEAASCVGRRGAGEVSLGAGYVAQKLVTWWAA